MAHRFDCLGPALNISARLFTYPQIPGSRMSLFLRSDGLLCSTSHRPVLRRELPCSRNEPQWLALVPSLKSFIRLGQIRVVRLFATYYHARATEGIDCLT